MPYPTQTQGNHTSSPPIPSGKREHAEHVGQITAIAGIPLPRPVRAVVFDLDGTLLDTERAYREAFLDTVAAFGCTLPPGAYDTLVGLSTTARRVLLPALLGEDCPTERFLDCYYTERASKLAAGIALKPGAARLLAMLHAKSVPVAIATSASAATAAAHLQAAGLAARFPVVVSRDDVTCGKPAPDSFLLAAERLGVCASDCLALEDSGHGVAAAHAAGMMVVMVPDLLAPAEAAVRLCVAVADTLDQVTGALETGWAGDRSRLCV